MNSIGLYKQGTVAQGKTKAYSKATDSTDPRGRLGYEEEREKVTEHDASEKDCTKLSTGCLDKLMLVVYDKDCDHSCSCYDAEEGQYEGYY